MIAYMFNCFIEHVKTGPVSELLQSITDVQMQRQNLIYSSVLDINLHILFHISTFIFQHGIYRDTMQNVYHHLTSQYTSQTSKWIVKN